MVFARPFTLEAAERKASSQRTELHADIMMRERYLLLGNVPRTKEPRIGGGTERRLKSKLEHGFTYFYRGCIVVLVARIAKTSFT